MKFEVDQSIRVEELNKNSVIAIANKGSGFSIVVNRHLKRKLFEEFKYLGIPKKFKPLFFSSVVILLIKRADISVKQLVVDIEYPGYETYISLLIRSVYKNTDVYFTNVGKSSPAHFYAYGVFSHKKKATFTSKYVELRRILEDLSKLKSN